MKNFFTATLFFLVLLSFSSCGENKEQNDASQLLMYKIRVKKFPEEKAAGVPWDVSGSSQSRLADLRLQILKDSASVWLSTGVYDNCPNYYYYEFLFEEYLIGDIDDTYTIILYDYDGTLLTSDIITRETFSPIDNIEGFPQSFTVKNDDCTFEIYADYIF